MPERSPKKEKTTKDQKSPKDPKKAREPKEPKEPQSITAVPGARKYRTPAGLKASVTTILAATQSARNRAALENWGKKNPGKGEEARNRGTYIHEIIDAQILRRPEPAIPENLSEVIEPYRPGIKQILWKKSGEPKITNPIWIEGPIDREKYKHCLTFDWEGNPTACVWTEEWAGKPDLIADFTFKGETKLSLIEIKTSKDIYIRGTPNRPKKPSVQLMLQKLPIKLAGLLKTKGGSWGRISYPSTLRTKIAQCIEEGRLDDLSPEMIDWAALYDQAELLQLEREKIYKAQTDQFESVVGGQSKFFRASVQMAAYEAAIIETLGVEIEQQVLLVVTPQGGLTFILTENEKTKAKEFWRTKVDEFKSIFPDD